MKEQLRGPEKGAREGLMYIYLECWERGRMHVGGTSSAINFAKRRLWFLVSLVKVSGILYSFVIKKKYLAYVFILGLYFNCS